MPGHRPLDGQVGLPAETAPATGSDGDPAAVSVAGFAAQLRELRERAGRPSYRQMAQVAHYSHTTGLRGEALARLQVDGSGLYVGYAVVTNLGTRTGYAYMINTGAGKVHRSPRPVRPGQSWTYFFNRELKDGAQICGSIDLGRATCADVHA
jgi:hypothetical protein